MLFSTINSLGKLPNRSQDPNSLFYGWIVVGACTVLLTVVLGVYYSFGVFLEPLQEEFGWSRATMSTLFSAYVFLSGLFAIVGGWASDRYGPRPVVLVMGILSGLSLLLTSRVGAAWQLYFTYSLLLAMGTGAAYIIVMSTGSRWFVRRRATALGIIGTGAGLGTVIMAPFSGWLIDKFDWRDAYLIMALIAWAIIIPFSLLLRKDPMEIGAHPDGDMKSSLPENSGQQSSGITPDEQALSEAIRTRNFWLFLAIWFAYSFCLHMVMSHLVVRAQGVGFEFIKAATILSILTGVTIPIRLLTGFLSDRVTRKAVAIMFGLLHGIALFWLVDADKMWMFYWFAILYGVAYGGIDPPITALIGDTFGVRRVGAIMGFLMIGWALGSALGPFFGGLMYDWTGGYEPAFFFAGLIMVAGTICIWALRTPREHSVPPMGVNAASSDDTMVSSDSSG